MGFSARQLIPPQVPYLNTLELSGEDDFIALGRKTLKGLMHLWLEEGDNFSTQLNRLHALCSKAEEWPPILPCLRGASYVSYGTHVLVFIPDHSLWLQGLVVAVRSLEREHFTAQCIFDQNIPGGDRQIELPMQSPYLLHGNDAGHITQCSRMFLNNWAYGTRPGSVPSTYLPMSYAELLYTKEG